MPIKDHKAWKLVFRATKVALSILLLMAFAFFVNALFASRTRIIQQPHNSTLQQQSESSLGREPSSASGGAVLTFWQPYKDLPEMAKAVDLIVVGQVKELQPGRIVVDSGGGETPFTNIHFFVEGVVTQTGLREPEAITREIILEQLGEAGNTGIVRVNNPMLEVGKRYILFLSKDNDLAIYSVGSPQGRFLVENGQIRQVSADYFENKYTGWSEDAFVQEIVRVLH